MNNFREALSEWMQRAQAIIDKAAADGNPSGKIEAMTSGKKYIRIVNNNSYVYAFIERSTGNVLFPGGWKAPTKRVTGNIYEIGKEGVDWHGALYARN